MMGNHPHQCIWYIDFEYRRDQQRQRPDVLLPRFAAQHLLAVGVAAHLLHGHPLLCLHSAAFRQVVHLREQVSKPSPCRFQPLGAAQHQRLVHKTVSLCGRFARRQFPAPLKQFLCFHISQGKLFQTVKKVKVLVVGR